MLHSVLRKLRAGELPFRVQCYLSPGRAIDGTEDPMCTVLTAYVRMIRSMKIQWAFAMSQATILE